MGIPKIDRAGILWFYAQEDKNRVWDRPVFFVLEKKKKKKSAERKKKYFFCLPDDFLSCVLWGGGDNFTSDANWQHHNPSPAFLSHSIPSFGTELSLGQN